MAKCAQEVDLEEEQKEIVRKAVLFSLERPEQNLISSISKYGIDEVREVFDEKLMCGKLYHALVIAEACLKENVSEVAMIIIGQKFAQREYAAAESYTRRANLVEDEEVLGMFREAYAGHMEAGEYHDAEELARLFDLKDERQKAITYAEAIRLIHEIYRDPHDLVWHLPKPEELDSVKDQAIEIVMAAILRQD
jgi:hypothetical protein